MAKKKSSTRSRLVDRAGKGRAKATGSKRRARRDAVEVETEAPSGARGERLAPGGMEIPGLQLDNVQDTVRTVVNYVQQNPLAAAAVAIGAGVMLTSMYWDSGSGSRRGR